MYKTPTTSGNKDVTVELDEDFDNYAFFIVVGYDDTGYRHNYFASTFLALEVTPSIGNPAVKAGDKGTEIYIRFDPENKKEIYLTSTTNNIPVYLYLVYGVKI